jgi:hypothetical protein
MLLVATLPGQLLAHSTEHAQEGKPNILMIMSDEVGIIHLSAYGRGTAGYRTLNIDRIADADGCASGENAQTPGARPSVHCRYQVGDTR